MPDFISRYLDDTVEFPNDVAYNPLPWGTIYEYVPSTLLNAFVNYTVPVKAFVLDRYWDEKDLKVVEVLENGEWIKFVGTKPEAFQKVTEPGRIVHPTMYDHFGDDVILLGKIKNGPPGSYMVFWFDCDPSDCCIGRFITSDPEYMVLDLFQKWVEKLQEREFDDPPAEIPMTYFSRGWISW